MCLTFPCTKIIYNTLLCLIVPYYTLLCLIVPYYTLLCLILPHCASSYPTAPLRAPPAARCFRTRFPSIFLPPPVNYHPRVHRHLLHTRLSLLFCPAPSPSFQQWGPFGLCFNPPPASPRAWRSSDEAGSPGRVFPATCFLWDRSR